MQHCIFSKSNLTSVAACTASLWFSSCKTTKNSQTANSNATPYCRPTVFEKNHTGSGEEPDKPCRIATDARREIYGKREVREPRCNVPCGKKIKIYSESRSIATTAVIYDACPSQHWNNRFKEVTEGKNPCGKGLMHLDLRKPLYHYLNGGLISDNIKVWVDPSSEQ